jgi:predicted outer membrane repeat protein
MPVDQTIRGRLARVFRRRVVILALMIGASYLLWGASAAALPLLNSTCAGDPNDYFTTIPNGTRMPLPGSGDACQTCHTSPPNFGSFGMDYWQQSPLTLSNPPSGIPSIAHTWDIVLASKDSNGNGYTNGEKLQDPTGAWIYGTSPANVGDGNSLANPGDAAQLPPQPILTAITGVAAGNTYSNTTNLGVTLDTTIGARIVLYEVLDGSLNPVASYTRQTSSTPYGGYTDSAATFNLAWNTYDVPNGTYILRATLYDGRAVSQGGPRTSTRMVANITIDNPGLIRYVAKSGANTGDCTNSAAPCATIDYAVAVAQHNDQVRVATGVYTPGVGANPLLISTPLTLVGGFTTADWTAPDPVAYPTILDGQHQRTVLSFLAASSGFMVQGFTIRNGSAANGGGVMIAAGAQGTLAGNIFENNQASGAGGALYSQANVNVVNALFANNSAPQGAAIATAQVDSAAITYATIAGGGTPASAIALTSQTRSVTVTNTLISGYGVGISITSPALSFHLTLQKVLAANDGANNVAQPVVNTGGGSVSGAAIRAQAGYKNSAAGDYHLAFGAPAIDAGEATPSITTDLDGHQRPFGGAPDIGAYEFGGPVGVVLFDTAEAEVTLPTNAATLIVEMSMTSLTTITVDYATHDGTAIAGVDYQPVSGTLLFAPGQIGKAFAIPVSNTGAVDPKLFTVTLSHPTGGVNLAPPSTATVTINPPVPIGPPRVMITARAPYAARAGSIPAKFTIDRDVLVDTPLTVYYSVGGTAIPGVDYVALSGKLTLPAGAYSGTILITPLGGSGDKTVIVTLTSRPEYVLGRRSATALIADRLIRSFYLPMIRR